MKITKAIKKQKLKKEEDDFIPLEQSMDSDHSIE